MLQQLDQYANIIILTFGGLLTVSIITQLILWSKFNRLNNNYKRITRGVDKKNLEELIIQLTESVAENNKNLDLIKKDQIETQKQLEKCIKTPEMIRFNAFDNIGSNLSFSAALLDNEVNGLVLTGIYSRDDSRLYAKAINNGASEQYLTPEEQAAIENFKKRNML